MSNVFVHIVKPREAPYSRTKQPLPSSDKCLVKEVGRTCWHVSVFYNVHM